MPYEAPKHLGRFQAASPFQSQESLDSRRGRSLDSYAELLRHDLAIEPNYTTIDASRPALSTNDEADGDSSDGTFHPGGN